MFYVKRGSVPRWLVIAGLMLFSKSAFTQTEAIEKALMLKDYTGAITLAEKYLNKSPHNKDEILLLLGEAYVGTSNLVKARETYRTLYKQCPNSTFARKAVLRIADSYYLGSDYGQAVKIYNYFLEEYGGVANFLPYVYLKLAYCHEKLGNWDYKRKYMALIKENYPDSLEATKLEELEKRGFHFVVQIGAFVDKDNAYKLIRDLKKKGFSPYLVLEKENGKRFFKVRAGKFTRRVAAESKLEALLEKGYPARIFP